MNFKGWSNYSFFFSAENTQEFLKKCYQKLGLENAEQKGYENCYSFIYYLEHGHIYFEQAEKAPLILKPILLFYGLAHLVKACILTVVPSYPESTAVLAHGVSTRKRKKQNYQFFHDEVKFQKNGLFPFMAETLFHMKQLEGDKATMEELLRLIPEMDSLFFQLENEKNFIPIRKQENEFFLSETILDRFHMTEQRFMDFLSSKTALNVSFSPTDNGHLIFTMDEDIFTQKNLFKYDLEEKHFVLPSAKSTLFQLPELLIHYLLLYNLSMIARYETEWWGELTKMMPNKDYPFIDSFMNVTLKKSPFLIYQFLVRYA
ncbi:MAG: YaaC family protein [Bacillota bacterium]|nr:YaaC family protein [Bacillota bacterium]